MIADCKVANTFGTICRRTPETPAHRVRYVLSSRKVQPIGRAGGAWIFSDEQVEFVLDELAKIGSRKGAAS